MNVTIFITHVRNCVMGGTPIILLGCYTLSIRCLVTVTNKVVSCVAYCQDYSMPA